MNDTVQHCHSGKVRFRDRIEAFVLKRLEMREQFYILKAEIVNDGRKVGAERTNSKVQEAFRQSRGFRICIDSRGAFFR